MEIHVIVGTTFSPKVIFERSEKSWWVTWALEELGCVLLAAKVLAAECHIVAHTLTIQTCRALEALQWVGLVHRIVEQWVLVFISVGDQVKTALADHKPKARARLVSFALGTSTAFQPPLSTRQAILSVEAFTCAIWLALESFWSCLTVSTVIAELTSIAMIDLPCTSQVVHQKLAPRLAIAFSTLTTN